MAVTPAQVRPGPTKKPTHSRHSSEVGYSEEPNGGTGAAEAGSLPASIDTKHATAAHRFNHNNSILAVAVAQDTLYAGTQGGEILVYNLQTYERLRAVTAHGGSVLGLCLTQAGSLLLSSAGDRHVNVWEPSNLTLLASLYSEYDTGDIFCVSWSARLQTVYFGAQNTSIQVRSQNLPHCYEMFLIYGYSGTASRTTTRASQQIQPPIPPYGRTDSSTPLAPAAREHRAVNPPPHSSTLQE